MAKKKRDTYQEVTNAIVEAFESGDVSKWTRPWKTVGLHKSANSGKDYRGINQFILFLKALAFGYTSNLWLTYKQAKALGGHVTKGQKGTQVVFWKWADRDRKDAEGNVIIGADGKPKQERVLLYATSYTVFNVEQCEDLDEAKLDKHRENAAPVAVDDALDDFVVRTGAQVREGGDRAFYSPSQDIIGMPARTQFDDSGAYTATLTHELTHWTGAKHRLDREFGDRFGENAYAIEELVAEMGSAFLCARFGTEGKLQHAEYITHWLKVLKADKSAIFTAASQAQKAVDFLVECQEDHDGVFDGEEAEPAARAA